jgi:hypothetical protein
MATCLVVLSMFASIGWILISKCLMQHHSPLIVTASVSWLGTVLLASAGTLCYRLHNDAIELATKAGARV